MWGRRASSSRFEPAHTGSKEASAHQLYGPGSPRLSAPAGPSKNLSVLASFKWAARGVGGLATYASD